MSSAKGCVDRLSSQPKADSQVNIMGDGPKVAFGGLKVPDRYMPESNNVCFILPVRNYLVFEQP